MYQLLMHRVSLVRWLLIFFPIKNHFKIFKKRIKSYLQVTIIIMLLVYLECETFINKKYAFFKDSINISLLFLSIKSFSLFSKMSFEGKINLCAFVKCSLKVVFINHITIFFLPISKSFIIIFCCNCFCYIICKSNEIVNLFLFSFTLLTKKASLMNVHIPGKNKIFICYVLFIQMHITSIYHCEWLISIMQMQT